jgi:23S rRNA pseudouridine1911/1915/1917 synthase
MDTNKFQAVSGPNGELHLTLAEDMKPSELYEALQVPAKRACLWEGKNRIENNGLPLAAGTRLIVKAPEEEAPVQTSFEPVNIVYEDEFSLVADKPAFLLVHDDGNTPDNLTSRVNAHLVSEGWPYVAQAVNRIDQEASGLVLFCKNPLFQSFFDRQMENRTAKKSYYAVLDGLLERRHVDINNPIGRNRHEADKMIVHAQGKPSHTHLERKARRGTMTLVQADISTGRKHQIRVHASSQGHAVVNDRLYGSVKDERGLLLQSFRLIYQQPVTGEEIDVQIPMDARFKEFFRRPAKNTRHRRG